MSDTTNEPMSVYPKAKSNESCMGWTIAVGYLEKIRRAANVSCDLEDVESILLTTQSRDLQIIAAATAEKDARIAELKEHLHWATQLLQAVADNTKTSREIAGVISTGIIFRDAKAALAREDAND